MEKYLSPYPTLVIDQSENLIAKLLKQLIRLRHLSQFNVKAKI